MGSVILAGIGAGAPDEVERSVNSVLGQGVPDVRTVRLATGGGMGFDELTGRRADLYLLVEAGTVLGPRCLLLLVRALERTAAGLAGPSTNLAWNEQRRIAAVGREPRTLDRDAGLLLRRFGYAVRSLDRPSLGDFCYLVRREVVEAVGGADSSFGDGPRWEIDYNTRAAAAGFAGIWVCGAYAWRPARNVALPPPARPAVAVGLAVPSAARRPPTPDPPRAAPPPARVAPRSPLVSCVMPTRDRAAFARQAVRYFLSQDYPDLELVIVEDGAALLADQLPADPRIRLLRAEERVRPRAAARDRLSIGALRNHGCAAAAGGVVVLWDDDDWYGPSRVSHQVAPILSGRADVTGLAGLEWFEPATWRCWRPDPTYEPALLRRGVYGGTLAFRRALWQRTAFPDRSLAEDADFLDRVIRAGARLVRLDGRDCYVYLRHEQNSWRLRPGGGARPNSWAQVPVPDLPAADLAFYATLARPARAPSTLVTCIMPTRDRRSYLPYAIDYFSRQTHRDAELVILDDGVDPVADLVPDSDAIRYERLDRPLLLGAKRNLACELARGELIAHWDDDDWQAPDRLTVQVAALSGARHSGADLCGAASLLFFDPAGGRAWRYSWPTGRRPWAAGTSLCYSRQLWQQHAFSEVSVGEDTRFVWQSGIRRVADVSAANVVVGLVHAGNTVPKSGRGSYWFSAGITEVSNCLGADMARYADPTRVTRTPRSVQPPKETRDRVAHSRS